MKRDEVELPFLQVLDNDVEKTWVSAVNLRFELDIVRTHVPKLVS